VKANHTSISAIVSSSVGMISSIRRTALDELLGYAMTLVKEKAAARINEVAMKDLPPKEKADPVLLGLKLFSLMSGISCESEPYLHFSHRFFICRDDLIDWLDENKLLKPNLDKEIEAEKMYAIADGLALIKIRFQKLIFIQPVNQTADICQDPVLLGLKLFSPTDWRCMPCLNLSVFQKRRSPVCSFSISNLFLSPLRSLYQDSVSEAYFHPASQSDRGYMPRSRPAVSKEKISRVLVQHIESLFI
jgi:hypothetical protein